MPHTLPLRRKLELLACNPIILSRECIIGTGGARKKVLMKTCIISKVTILSFISEKVLRVLRRVL